ncbi:discoidin domain-containing protein [Luteolibacter ambystomatis]|uniref:Discoidin domain-containing protein n=1 Tax=Luteolibacter ambystomatis TaxID=2824561 RepID=A0A975G6Q8_9BACT|nr:discoidin domain-containing protein [Luteolibacter ambystomatis]
MDLGEAKECNTLDIAWETARPARVEVEISTDGGTWKQVAAAKVGGDRTRIGFQTIKARQVRVVMKEPVTVWGYSVFELEVLKRAGR